MSTRSTVPRSLAILITFLLLISPFFGNAQCGQLTVSSSKDSICSGDSTFLSSKYLYPYDDLNGNYDTAIWDTVHNGTIDNSCGSVEGDALYFTGDTRRAVMQEMDLSDAEKVEFCLKIGGGSSPCEDAESGEDIVLEYSTDGGATWTGIDTYFENSYTSWTCLSATLPAGAKTANTKLRWDQVSFSSGSYDNWALDKVGINRADTSLSYSWSPSTDVSDPNQASTDAFPTSTTDFVLSVNNTTAGCSISDTLTVTVSSLSVKASGPDSICEGDYANLNANANYSGASYSWSPTDSLSCVNCSSPSANPMNDVEYVVTASLSGCSDAKDSVYIQVDTLPSVDAGKDTMICSGDTAQLDGSPSGYPSYSWSPFTSLSSSSVEDPKAWPSVTTDYELTVYDGSCTNSDTVRVSINNLSAHAATDKDTICPGDSAQLDVNSVLGSDDFDGGYDGSLWSAVNEGFASTDCGSMSGDALYFDGTGTRNAISTSMDANGLDSIAFCIKIAGGTSPCEDASSGEGVNLEYSTDGGTTWNLIDSYSHTITTWSCFKVDVPAGAKTSSTLFRWEQQSHSGSGYDNWSIDNVRYLGDTTIAGASYAWSPSSSLSDASIKDPKAFPSSSTTYTVTVTDSMGCTTEDSVSVAVTSLSVTASAGADSVCEGDSTFLSGSSNLSGVSLAWSPSGDVKCDTCANTLTDPLLSSTDFVLTGTRGGCTDDDTVTVDIHPLPNVSASGDTSICYGNTVQISASGAQVYSWTPSGSLSDPTVSDPLASPADTTTYTVTGTDNNGCSEQDSVTVGVEGGPVMATADSDSLCPGDSVQLHAVTGSFGDDFNSGTYSGSFWSAINEGTVNTDCGSESGEALYFDGAGTRNAVTKAINANSCSMISFCIKIAGGTAPCEDASSGEGVNLEYSTDGGTTWNMIDSYSHTVSTWSCFSVTIPAGAKTNSTMFRWEQVSHSGSGYDNWAIDEVALDCGSGAGWSFSWSPSGDMDDASSQDPMAYFGGKTTYEVTATDGNCSVSDQVTVYEGTFDLVTSTTNASCGSDDGSATVTASGGTSPYSYQWNDPNNQTTATADSLGAGSYTVTVTDANGCTASETVIVQDNGTVSANIYDHTDPSCHGAQDGMAVASASGGTSPYTYKWDDPNNQSNDTAVGLSGGVYTVTVTDQNGCQGIDTVHLKEPDSIVINVSSSPASCATCSDGLAWADVSGGVPPYSYSWNDSLNQNGDTAYSLEPGTYKVEVTDANGCKNIARVTVGDGTGSSIADRTGSDQGGMFNYFPNPARDEVTVEYELAGEGEASLVLRDQVGRIVHREQLKQEQGRHRLDVSDKASGVYFIGIRQKGEKPMFGKLFIGR